jgi:hypothetical protein
MTGRFNRCFKDISEPDAVVCLFRWVPAAHGCIPECVVVLRRRNRPGTGGKQVHHAWNQRRRKTGTDPADVSFSVIDKFIPDFVLKVTRVFFFITHESHNGCLYLKHSHPMREPAQRAAPIFGLPRSYLAEGTLGFLTPLAIPVQRFRIVTSTCDRIPPTTTIPLSDT